MQGIDEDHSITTEPPHEKASPKHSSKRRKTQDDHEAWLSSARGWADVDTDTFMQEIYESRSRSSRPPVEL